MQRTARTLLLAALPVAMAAIGGATAIAAEAEAPTIPIRLTVGTDPADEVAAFDIEVDGTPLRVTNTTPRQVEVALGRPLTLQLVDPDPDHILTEIACSTREGIDAVRTFGDLDLEAGRVTFDDPPSTLTGCGFWLSHATVARTVTLAAEADPAAPGASVSVVVDAAEPVVPVDIAPGSPRTFAVPADEAFRLWSAAPSAPYVIDGLACLDQHGRGIGFIDPTTGASFPPGTLPSRPVALLTPPGSDVTCTYRLLDPTALRGGAIVRVATEPADAGARFGFAIDGARTAVAMGDPYVVAPSAADRATIELIDPGPDHQLGAIECTRDDGSEVTPIEFGPDAGRVVVALEPADVTDCSYRLQRAPTIPIRLTVGTDPADEVAAFDIEVDGTPLRVTNTTPRQVEVALGRPLTLQLVDPDPDHILTEIACSTREGIDAVRTFGDLDLEAGRVTFDDPPSTLTGCGFWLSHATVARTVTLAAEADPAAPGASVSVVVDAAEPVVPVDIAPGSPRTFAVPADEAFRLWSAAPSAPYVIDGLACLDQHGRGIGLIDPTTGASFPPGTLPSRPVALLTPPGSDVTCTYRLLEVSPSESAPAPGADEASLTILVDGILTDDDPPLVAPIPAGAGPFGLELDAEALTLGADERIARGPLEPGPITITVTDPGPLSFDSAVCTDVDAGAGTSTGSDTAAVGASVSHTLLPGTATTCVLYFSEPRTETAPAPGEDEASASEPPTDDTVNPPEDEDARPDEEADEPTKPSVRLPKAGNWSVDTTNVKFTCGGRTVALPSRKGEPGWIKVDAAKSAFTIGDPNSGAAARMKLKNAKKNTFVGTSTHTEGGQSIKFQYNLKVNSPRKITGKLVGKAKLNGQNCTMTENYTATFKGK